MTPSSLPAIAFITMGAFFFLFAVRTLIRQRRLLEMVPDSNVTLQLPTKWDDGEITKVLQRYQDQPGVLAHAVTSIKTRMILGQDLKTAQQRLKVMAGVLEVFKLNKEMQGVLHDIHLDQKEFEIKQIEAQVRKEDAQARLQSEGELRKLRKQRDELQLKKEISQLEQDIKNVAGPAAPEPKLSAEQQRRLKRMEIEDKLRELDRLEDALLQKAQSEEDRRRIQNMHTARREELNEQLAKVLV